MGNITCQIIIDGKEKQITLQEDIATILRIFNKDSAEELTLKKVRDICGDDNNNFYFYIANYQRGYRWGKDEVEALLDDIYKVYLQGDKASEYCLQPLVVKKRDNAMYTKKLGELDESGEIENFKGIGQACYELLDGQQRLTTLWLILNTLNEQSPLERMYSIYYELVRKVDENFICKAKDTIKCWFDCHEEFNTKAKGYKSKRKEEDLDLIEVKRQKYKKIILDHLYFIWYEVKDEKIKENERPLEDGQTADQGQSEKLFRKINKGKIELTNAELFKAMLLNDENVRTEEDRRGLEQISFEWDKIEQSLRDDDFWYFVSSDKSEERTRIDYILEVYARGKDDKEKFDVTKDRYSFLVVQDYLIDKKDNAGNIDFESIKTVWKDIVSVYDKLYSWYQDDELYHNIGFLVACEGRRRSAAVEVIVDLYRATKDKDKGKVKSYVKGKIQTIFAEIAKHISGGEMEDKEYLNGFDVGKITYDINKKDLRSFLLYSNIYPIIKVIQKCEAEFKSIKEEKSESEKKKRIEMLNETHIERFPFKKYYQTDWDIEHINPQTPITEEEAVEKFAFDENYSKIYEDEIKKYKAHKSSEGENNKEIDTVSNLVLLDSTTNRQYHNALFGFKRYCIIQRDKSGKYILPQTRRVFLKYDNLNPTWIEWTKQDQEAYMEELCAMIKFIQGKG